MGLFSSIFGCAVKPRGTEKPLDHDTIEYLGGHMAYPEQTYSEIYYYEDRMELSAYRIIIPFNQIKHIDNTRERKRHEDWIALGLVGLLWKKNVVYTIIEYNDESGQSQKIVLDFGNKANYAQGLIYNKMKNGGLHQ